MKDIEIPDEAEGLIEELLLSARAAWPTIEVSDELFLRYVGERLPKEGALRDAIVTLPIADLYLACACAHRNPQALQVFEESCFRELKPIFTKLRITEVQQDELIQTLRFQLFLGEGESTPKILSYAGQGPLHKWLRVVATREALRLQKSGKKYAPLEELGSEEVLSDVDDSELHYLKETYRDHFRRAFSTALRALSPQQRLVLRLRHQQSLNFEQIGHVLHVHKSTAMRQLEKAHAELMEETRRGLMASLKIEQHTLESIMRDIRSHLDVTLSSFSEIK